MSELRRELDSMLKTEGQSMSEPEFLYDIQQGTPEWFEVRRGIPTASNFKTIMVGGKGCDTYKRKLAGELKTGRPAEAFKTPAMQRGNDMEPEARDYFSRKQMVDVTQCGFVRRKLSSGRYVGASPDGLFKAGIGALLPDSILEIKTMQPDLMIASRQDGYNPNECPSEHVSQVQGNLWVTDMKRAELIVYYSGMGCNHYTVARDERYIAELVKAVERFDVELAALFVKVKEWFA